MCVNVFSSHKELLFLLYFYKTQNVTSQEVREDVIITVLTSSATNETGGVVILGRVHVQVNILREVRWE